MWLLDHFSIFYLLRAVSLGRITSIYSDHNIHNQAANYTIISFDKNDVDIDELHIFLVLKHAGNRGKGNKTQL